MQRTICLTVVFAIALVATGCDWGSSPTSPKAPEKMTEEEKYEGCKARVSACYAILRAYPETGRYDRDRLARCVTALEADVNRLTSEVHQDQVTWHLNLFKRILNTKDGDRLISLEVPADRGL